MHTEIRDGSQSLWCNLHGKPVTDDDTCDEYTPFVDAWPERWDGYTVFD